MLIFVYFPEIIPWPGLQTLLDGWQIPHHFDMIPQGGSVVQANEAGLSQPVVQVLGHVGSVRLDRAQNMAMSAQDSYRVFSEANQQIKLHISLCSTHTIMCTLLPAKYAYLPPLATSNFSAQGTNLKIFSSFSAFTSVVHVCTCTVLYVYQYVYVTLNCESYIKLYHAAMPV